MKGYVIQLHNVCDCCHWKTVFSACCSVSKINTRTEEFRDSSVLTAMSKKTKRRIGAIYLGRIRCDKSNNDQSRTCGLRLPVFHIIKEQSIIWRDEK